MFGFAYLENFTTHSRRHNLLVRFLKTPIFDPLPADLDASLIDLSALRPFAKGGTRLCFIHPENSSLCIKVDNATSSKKASLLEAQYVARLKRLRRRDQFSSINKHYGLVKTSLGIGSVSEIVRDEADGKISDNLHQYFLKENWRDHRRKLEDALEDFRMRILADGIVIRSMYADNICVQRLHTNGIKLYSIDGVGHKATLPKRVFFDFSASLTKHKMRRTMNKHFFHDVEALAKDHTERVKNRGVTLQE